ncbi:MAG: hypothetical protein QM773_02805 [Hyphomonadaceae bacterium]
MKRLGLALIGLSIAACDGKPSEPKAPPPASENVDQDYFSLLGTFDDHTPYRGHEPFAGIVYNPAYGIDAFVLRFYDYWSGFEDKGDAQRHVLVRRTRQFDVQNGELELLDRAVDHWADSRSCPAVSEAMKMFAAALPSVAVDLKAQSWESVPYSSKEAEQSATMDRPIGHCNCLDVWANLGEDFAPGVISYRLDIKTSGYPVDSELGGWTSRFLKSAESCFGVASPEIPTGPVSN